jgi:hypothetical protein
MNNHYNIYINNQSNFVFIIGIVDIHALTMSLKSRLPLEVITALNTLTVVTAEKSVALPLSSCGDLTDAIMELLLELLTEPMSNTINSTDQPTSIKHKKDNNTTSPASTASTSISTAAAAATATVADFYQSNVELLNQELRESLELRPTEHIKTRSELEQTQMESQRDQCQCLMTILRNLSFLPDNQVVIAQHRLIFSVLEAILTLKYKDKSNEGTRTPSTAFEAVDIGELRQHTLILLSNISNALLFTLDSAARIIIHFLVDWLDAAEHNRPSSTTVAATTPSNAIASTMPVNSITTSTTASLALEILARITVQQCNREFIGRFPRDFSYQRLIPLLHRLMQTVSHPVIVPVQTPEGQQNAVDFEMTVMAIYNWIESLSDADCRELLLATTSNNSTNSTTTTTTDIPDFSPSYGRGLITALLRIAVADTPAVVTMVITAPPTLTPSIGNHSSSSDQQTAMGTLGVYTPVCLRACAMIKRLRLLDTEGWVHRLLRKAAVKVLLRPDLDPALVREIHALADITDTITESDDGTKSTDNNTVITTT